MATSITLEYGVACIDMQSIWRTVFCVEQLEGKNSLFLALKKPPVHVRARYRDLKNRPEGFIQKTSDGSPVRHRV